MNQTVVLSFQTLRQIRRFIVLSIPITLILGSIVIGNCKEIQGSLSGYYYAVMRDIFVGTLCIVEFFLFAYNGYEKRDKITGELACLFAIVVAFFPTTIDPPIPNCIIGNASSIP
jgi:hypothetical protein